MSTAHSDYLRKLEEQAKEQASALQSQPRRSEAGCAHKSNFSRFSDCGGFRSRGSESGDAGSFPLALASNKAQRNSKWHDSAANAPVSPTFGRTSASGTPAGGVSDPDGSILSNKGILAPHSNTPPRVPSRSASQIEELPYSLATAFRELNASSPPSARPATWHAPVISVLDQACLSPSNPLSPSNSTHSPNSIPLSSDAWPVHPPRPSVLQHSNSAGSPRSPSGSSPGSHGGIIHSPIADIPAPWAHPSLQQQRSLSLRLRHADSSDGSVEGSASNGGNAADGTAADGNMAEGNSSGSNSPSPRPSPGVAAPAIGAAVDAQAIVSPKAIDCWRPSKDTPAAHAAPLSPTAVPPTTTLKPAYNPEILLDRMPPANYHRPAEATKPGAPTRRQGSSLSGLAAWDDSHQDGSVTVSVSPHATQGARRLSTGGNSSSSAWGGLVAAAQVEPPPAHPRARAISASGTAGFGEGTLLLGVGHRRSGSSDGSSPLRSGFASGLGEEGQRAAGAAGAIAAAGISGATAAEAGPGVRRLSGSGSGTGARRGGRYSFEQPGRIPEEEEDTAGPGGSPGVTVASSGAAGAGAARLTRGPAGLKPQEGYEGDVSGSMSIERWGTSAGLHSSVA